MSSVPGAERMELPHFYFYFLLQSSDVTVPSRRIACKGLEGGGG